MDAEMTFRKDCLECGRSFLTRDKAAKFCPRCGERVKERREAVKKAQAAEAEAARKREAEKKASHPVPPAAPEEAQSPLLLTEALRERVCACYESYRGRTDLTLKNIHKEIAKELQLPKSLVAGALHRERILTAQEEKEVIRRYQRYVTRMERPLRGRRRTIAEEMGIPYGTVADCLREWTGKQPSLQSLTREQRFRIEKNYFRFLEEGKTLAQTMAEIAKETAFDPWQVARYLDLLHDGEQRLKKVPQVTDDQREVILTGYGDYLAAPSPPGPFLHDVLKEKAGGTDKQVYKVLLAYRLSRLREIQARPE
jgi:predicted RNA-binding Zn-ribbon protein involved in translation (DUF1610 family)/AraC-like DNA-binding protein